MISRVYRRGSDERHCACQLEGSPAKEAIVSLVTSATTPGPAFIDVEDRIATFDNDGTLWVEQPLLPQFGFVSGHWAEEMKADPSWWADPPQPHSVNQRWTILLSIMSAC